MSKQILPSELAAIVSNLLMHPEQHGELDTPEQHHRFMEAIGNVVADFCGGTINGVNPAMGQADGSEDGQPMLSVSPDENLPSLERNIWSDCDPDGWEEEIAAQAEKDANPRPERFRARFYPQAWQNKYAIAVDPEGETEFDVTEEVEAILANDGEIPEADTDQSDELKDAANAPKWVRDWSGPFYIEVIEIKTPVEAV
jgi:hypothetical protein